MTATATTTMSGFLTEGFLLSNDAARRLYHEFAAPQPILDYHCHLSPRDIAENRQFANLFEMWLEGDHYKWRAMRANGIPEKHITGDAAPYEKFLAWARTVPYTLRNPLYHWTHLELQRYFGITELLDVNSAQRIWEQANSVLQGSLDVYGILQKFNVKTIGTTDDPADSLEYHAQIAASSLPTRVVPAFRPDAALRVDAPAAFNAWTDRLAAAADKHIDSFATFLGALEQRVQDFHAIGCRISDHGLDICFAEQCTDTQAAAIFEEARSGKAANAEDHLKFASYL